MAQWISFLLLAAAATIALVESRAIPAEPVSVMLDPYGNPIVFLREKRTAVHPYPQRAMMFTGYYRPVRRSGNGGQATGVFAQGNAVSGEAFFGGMQTPHLKGGPEPIEEQEVSSAEAHAAPADDSYNETEDGQAPEDTYHQENHQPELHNQPEEHPLPGLKDEHQHQQQEEEQEQQHRDQQQDNFPPEAEQAPESVPVFTTEAAAAVPEEPSAPTTKATVSRPKVHQVKKTRKPVVDEVDDEDEDDEEDEPVVPFVPFNKGNRRRQNFPHLNNFFPMVFSFPGVSTRSGSAGSPPGAVTAIANSYSTGKGGVASSMATAYGGSPNGKKRRPQAAEE